MTLIWPFKIIQGQRSWGQRKDHIWIPRNFGHNMHGFRDISPNRLQRSKFDLSDLAKITFILIPQSTYCVTVLKSSHQSYTMQNINISHSMHCLWDTPHRKLNDLDSIFKGHLRSKVIRSYMTWYTCFM